MATAGLRVSIVVPCYNEAATLPITLKRLRALCDAQWPGQSEVIVVDDGSTDETAAAACAAAWPGLRVLCLERNTGKGAAVRRGLQESRGAAVAITDGDLAYGTEAVAEMVTVILAGGAAAVFGSRFLAVGQDNTRPRWRLPARRLLAHCTARLLFTERYDTQCGCKALHGDVARRLAASATIDGFAIDIEMLALLRRWQAAVTWQPVRELETWRDSRVRPLRDGLRLIKDLLALARQYGKGR